MRALIALGCLLVPASAARAAATINVTTTVDDGVAANPLKCPGAACSLRDATLYANAYPGSTIELPAGVYSLSANELMITAPVTIDGHGASDSGTEIVQQAGSERRVLEIAPTTAGRVSISNLEITGGNVVSHFAATPALGGGVLIDPTVNGVSVVLSQAMVDHNTVTGASSAGGTGLGEADGAGIAVAPASPVTVDLSLVGTTVADNSGYGGPGTPSLSSNGGDGGDVNGGGVYKSAGGSLRVASGSEIVGNLAEGGNGEAGGPGDVQGAGGQAAGGGIFVRTGAIDVADSTIVANNADGGFGSQANPGENDGEGGSAGGGGVFANLATTSIVRSSITSNAAAVGPDGTGGTANTANSQAGFGGGLYLAGPVTISQSTISDNVVQSTSETFAEGGGLLQSSAVPAPLNVVNSTIAQNGATGSGTTTAGGVLTSGGQAIFVADTIDGNQARTGASNLGAPGATTLAATIVADPGGVAHTNCSGTITSLGHNLTDDSGTSCAMSAAHDDVVGKHAKLGPQSNNGGETVTLLPLPGSPAVGQGGTCTDLTEASHPRLNVDQRGLPRPSTRPCDIGAVQVQLPLATTPPSVTLTHRVFACNRGTWTSDGFLSYAISWLRAGKVIRAAKNTTYAETNRDVGHRIACRVRATSAYGLSTIAASRAVEGLPFGPTVSRFRQSHKVWREPGSRGRAPTGTVFKFVLANGPARIQLTFRERIKRRWRTVGTLAIRGHVGEGKVAFTGSLPTGIRLKPGGYQVTIVAIGHGGARSIPLTLRFRLVA
jgi:hypothetical protein